MHAPEGPQSPLEFRSVRDPEDLRELAGGRLSATFDPFLPSFARQILAAGGSAEAGRRGDRLDALLLFVAAERLGTAFARVPPDLGVMGSRVAPGDLFVEHAVPGIRETLDVLRFDLERHPSGHALRHSVRVADPSDRDALSAIADSSSLARRWTDALWAGGETAFVAEVDGRIVGTAWAGRAGPFGRVHSLCVSPGYRRLGIGADLLEARLRWLRAEGAREVVTEIAIDNLPSLAITRHAGGAPIGRMYRARWERAA